MSCDFGLGQTRLESELMAINACGLPAESLASVRQALERQAGIEAARVHDRGLIARLEEACDVIETAQGKAAADLADYEFHYYLLRASKNEALAFFADALSSVLNDAMAERRATIRRLASDPAIVAKAHRDIVTAIAAGDSDAAGRAVDAHFATYERLIEDHQSRPRTVKSTARKRASRAKEKA